MDLLISSKICLGQPEGTFITPKYSWLCSWVGGEGTAGGQKVIQAIFYCPKATLKKYQHCFADLYTRIDSYFENPTIVLTNQCPNSPKFQLVENEKC